MPDLTVIIPTIPGREHLLSRLLWTIQEQPAAAGVEVLVIDGDWPLGDKVNLGARTAVTEHITIVDDDDMLAATYFDLVLPALDTDPDYVGFKVLELDAGRYSHTTATDGNVGGWGRVRRGPCPKGITRRSIVIDTPMRNHYTADRAWMTAVAPKLARTVFIDRVLYLYDFWRSGSAFFDGHPRDVGEWPVDWSTVTRF